MKKVLLVLLALAISLFAQININSANVKELTKLKGIGAKKAEAIIAYRDANGGFKSVDELTKVRGIGNKILDKVKSEIVVK